MRGSVRTLGLLQELGFTYHNNDMSRDEPFTQDIDGKPFVSVPYTFHMNDIVAYDFTGFSPADYERQLRDEFDQLYEEGASRRRMMLISLHDRLSGHASRVRVLDRFLTCEEPPRCVVRAQGRDREARTGDAGHHAES